MRVQVPAYSSPASLNAADPASAPNANQEIQVPATDADAAKTQIPTAKEQSAVERKDLEKIVDQMNKTLEVYNYDLKFEIVDKHRIVISIINSSTGEVIKQIPPEDLVKSSKQMDAFLGMLVDRKV